jgi:hypothetical protein
VRRAIPAFGELMRRGRGGGGIKEETRERKNAVLFLEKRNERGKKASSAMPRKAPSMKVNSNRATLSKLSKPSQHEAAARRRRSSKLKKKPRPKGPRMRSSGFSFPAPSFSSNEERKKNQNQFPAPRPPPFYPSLATFFPPHPSASFPLLFPSFATSASLPRGRATSAIDEERFRGKKLVLAKERRREKKGRRKNVGSVAESFFFISLVLSKRAREGKKGRTERERSNYPSAPKFYPTGR